MTIFRHRKNAAGSVKGPGLAILCGLLMLGACAPVGHYRSKDAQHSHADEAEEVVIRASGYGTYSSAQAISAKDRLLARRASRLDAYRALAEQVNGIVIFGDSQVRDFAMNSDRFQTMIDTHLRGARVVAVRENVDGVIETVMEMRLPEGFSRCFDKAFASDNTDLCLFTDQPNRLETSEPSTRAEAPASGQSLYYLE